MLPEVKQLATILPENQRVFQELAARPSPDGFAMGIFDTQH